MESNLERFDGMVLFDLLSGPKEEPQPIQFIHFIPFSLFENERDDEMNRIDGHWGPLRIEKREINGMNDNEWN